MIDEGESAIKTALRKAEKLGCQLNILEQVASSFASLKYSTKKFHIPDILHTGKYSFGLGFIKIRKVY